LVAIVSAWWKDFFDADYIRIWGEFIPAEKTASEVEGLWQLLRLHEGSRVLDAPCGYGRLARPLAERGCLVLGVDQSEALLQHAESHRGDLPPERLRYLQHDLRQPLQHSGFDAAINIFSSLGYGTEEDDLAILRNLRDAVRLGGLVLVETMHRDLTVLNLLHNPPSQRLSDGTLVLQEVQFDSIAGRVLPRWYWSGPKGSGTKTASFRTYAAPELVALLQKSGLRFCSAHRGCSPEPFQAVAPDMGGRLAIVATRD
jgi:SAM-dependent methyltransferase